MVSVNDKNFTGLSLAEAESTIKSLPRGVVKIVALPPPCEVIGAAATKKEERGNMAQTQSKVHQTPAKSIARASNTKDKMSLGIGNLEKVTPPSSHGDKAQKNEEEGVVKVKVKGYNPVAVYKYIMYLLAAGVFGNMHIYTGNKKFLEKTG